MKKKIHIAIIVIIMLILSIIPVRASTPNQSYNETYWSNEAAAPDAYEAVERYNGQMMGTDSLVEPKDISVDEKGFVYIADTGNNRIVVLDNQMQLVSSIHEVTINGEVSALSKPQGVYASGGYIYIADTENGRALKITGDGIVKAQYLIPKVSEYTSEFYRPVKLAVDKDNMVFILSEGVYQGFLLYEGNGNFKSFFGSARVQPTFKLLMDKLWKRLLSKQQRNSMRNYVPTEYENLTMDDNGFLYACCLHTDNNVEQIRKLNYLGNNIYPYTGNFGEKSSVYYKQTSIITTFTDVVISEDNILFGLDNTRGRVYGFDQEGNRLFEFGALGEMEGAFQSAESIDVKGQTIYVLDSKNGTITLFKPTEYGSLILEVISYYSQGKFAQAQELWGRLLKMNTNLELAYSGMGEALLKSGKYKEAIQNFKQGNNPERESVAFAKYRAQLIRKNPVLISCILIALLVVILLLSRRKFWQKRHMRRKEERKADGSINSTLKVARQTLSHPITTMTELKYKRYRNWLLVGIVLVWWFLLRIAIREWTGFRFNSYEEGSLNIFMELLFSIVPFVLFCLANWACCSILDGEGRFDEICTFIALAIVPYLLIQTLGIPLSNLFCLTEKDFFEWLLLFGNLWTAFLLFQAVRITHQYSAVKTILLILISIIGIVIILFLILLIVALVLQMYSFVITIVSEMSYTG